MKTPPPVVRAFAKSLPLLMSCACMVGPDYETPKSEVNTTWLEGTDANIDKEKAATLLWWKTFNDPVLDSLIEKASRQNLSLRSAGVRVLQAMAERGIAVGNLFPQVQEINGSANRSKFSENPPRSPAYSKSASISFDATWELDFWGKFRRAIEGADANLEATVATYDDVMVALLAEVAITYVDIRTRQAGLDIAERNVKAQEDGLKLTQSRFRLGADSELDVTQATSILEQTRASIPLQNAQLRQAMFRLNLLLGTPPKEILEELGKPGIIPDAPSALAIGIPADLLRRRPDIRIAERNAAAQSAFIGVAKADLYPSFFLSGSLGFSSADVSNLLTGKSWAGAITPGFSWPILNYGRITNNIRAQDAAFQAAILNYQNTVLNAAREVEDGLAGFVGAQGQVTHLTASVKASKRSLELATIRYKEGTSTFTRVLNSMQQMLRAENTLNLSRSQVALQLIATHKALGGGWELREGRSLVPEDTRREMTERTDWGGLLDESPVEPADKQTPGQPNVETDTEADGK
jgi:NodT family efflux transporter outer membrane factor (OMF) lipoprotein